MEGLVKLSCTIIKNFDISLTSGYKYDYLFKSADINEANFKTQLSL